MDTRDHAGKSTPGAPSPFAPARRFLDAHRLVPGPVALLAFYGLVGNRTSGEWGRERRSPGTESGKWAGVAVHLPLLYITTHLHRNTRSNGTCCRTGAANNRRWLFCLLAHGNRGGRTPATVEAAVPPRPAVTSRRCCVAWTAVVMLKKCARSSCSPRRKSAPPGSNTPGGSS